MGNVTRIDDNTMLSKEQGWVI